MKIKAIIEIPKDSRYKYEVSKFSGALQLDRPLNQAIPHNYGYIPDTICADADELDIFVISEHPIPSLTEVHVDILGVYRCRDGGVSDDKIVAILPGEYLSKEEISVAISNICLYLKTYKDGFVVDSYENAGQAITAIQLSRVWLNPAD